MLAMMTTGEPIKMPEGVSRAYLWRMQTDLSQLYCSECGIVGTESSVYAIAAVPCGVVVLISCDFCERIGRAEVHEVQL